MKIVWLSANKLGYELLKEAVKLPGIRISAVVTLAEGVRTVMYDGVDARLWDKFGLQVHRVAEINKAESLLRRLSPDLVVMCGWRQVVETSILSIPRNGFIGFHPSLLPSGRGPAPIINTLLAGETRSGVTMFYVSPGIDDGDIIAQKEFRIAPKDHAFDVYRKVVSASKVLVREFLPRVVREDAPRTAQDPERAHTFDKPSLQGNRIDLDKDGLEHAYRKIRALSRPYRGAYIEKGNKRLVIWEAELQDRPERP